MASLVSSSMASLVSSGMFGEWPAESGGAEAKKLFFNFLAMTMCFSINHGTVGAVIGLTTSLLGTHLGSANLGTLWLMYVLTALTVSGAIIGAFGSKGGLMAGTAGYCLWILSFSIAAELAVSPPTGADLTPESCVAAGPPGICSYTAAHPAATPPVAASCSCDATDSVKLVSQIGAGFGGIAAGFLWTAQGAYFARNAELYAEAGGRIWGAAAGAEGSTVERATGLFASIFAAFYLLWEVVMKLLSSILPKSVQLPFYAVAAAGSAAGILLIMPLPPAVPPAKKPLLQKVTAASSLLASYRPIQLLAPTEMVFGFSAAMMNAYVNGELVSCENDCVGYENIGYFGTVTTLTAAAASTAAGWYTSQKKGGVFRGKTPVMLGGNGAFILLGLLVLSIPVTSFYGSFALLVPLYVLQGLGRGIFESTNKAVIADYCPGAKAESGFANFVILSGSASTLMFFLIPILKHHPSCTPASDAADEKSATVCGHLSGHANQTLCEASPCVYDPGTSAIDFGKPVFAAIVLVCGSLALGLFPMAARAGAAEARREGNTGLLESGAPEIEMNKLRGAEAGGAEEAPAAAT